MRAVVTLVVKYSVQYFIRRVHTHTHTHTHTRTTIYRYTCRLSPLMFRQQPEVLSLSACLYRTLGEFMP